MMKMKKATISLVLIISMMLSALVELPSLVQAEGETLPDFGGGGA